MPWVLKGERTAGKREVVERFMSKKRWCERNKVEGFEMMLELKVKRV